MEYYTITAGLCFIFMHGDDSRVALHHGSDDDQLHMQMVARLFSCSLLLQ
jgi:hypothetical protein